MVKEDHGRREVRLNADVRDIVKWGRGDEWRESGKARHRQQHEGFYNIPPVFRGRTPMDVIAGKLEAGGCRLMVLGPSRGEDVGVAYQFIEGALSDRKLLKGFSIDVFGLTKSVTPNFAEIVRTDYSMPAGKPAAFENYAHPRWAGAYDVVVAQQSVGVHTRDPLRAVAKSAALLDVDGVAFIEVLMPMEAGEASKELSKFHGRFGRACKRDGTKFSVSFQRKPKAAGLRPHPMFEGTRYWATIERKK